MKFINDNISKVIYETEEEEKGDRILFVTKKLSPFYITFNGVNPALLLVLRVLSGPRRSAGNSIHGFVG